MAQKNRNDITAAIETNIYPNNNKEITAEMIQSVLDDFRDSFFNLIDDRLKNYHYNDAQTLEQYLSAVVGSLPLSGSVQGINVGEANSGYDVGGIILSAKTLTVSGPDMLIDIQLKNEYDLAGREIIPVLHFNSADYNLSNDVLYPVVRQISGKNIRVGLREMAGAVQNLELRIIVI